MDRKQWKVLAESVDAKGLVGAAVDALVADWSHHFWSKTDGMPSFDAEFAEKGYAAVVARIVSENPPQDESEVGLDVAEVPVNQLDDIGVGLNSSKSTEEQVLRIVALAAAARFAQMSDDDVKLLIGEEPGSPAQVEDAASLARGIRDALV